MDARDLERLADGLHRTRPRRCTAGRQRGAVDGPRVHLSRGVPERLVGGFRRAVRPEHPGLPAAEVALVDQVEVEVGADRRLAGCDPDRVGELHRLIDARPDARVRGFLLRPGGDRSRIRLGTRVQRGFARVRHRLVALRQVPDRRRAFARDGLRRAVEAVAERLHQGLVVADRDRRPGCVLRPGALGRSDRVRDVAEGVEDRLRPPARLVGLRHLGDPCAGSVVAEREGTGCGRRLGDCERDDVCVGANSVRGVPALGQQRLVVGGRGALAARGELRAPERVVVRVVPDDDVLDLAVASEQVGHETAVLRASLRRSRHVGGRAVHADDDP